MNEKDSIHGFAFIIYAHREILTRTPKKFRLQLIMKKLKLILRFILATGFILIAYMVWVPVFENEPARELIWRTGVFLGLIWLASKLYESGKKHSTHERLHNLEMKVKDIEQELWSSPSVMTDSRLDELENRILMLEPLDDSEEDEAEGANENE